MRYTVATHNHSLYSFDCNTPIKDIVASCLKNGVNVFVITDHDCYGFSTEDEALFLKAGIFLLKGIEFTSKEGAHIIGIADHILEFQAPAFTYSALELVKTLKAGCAHVIFPHPTHPTGILSKGIADDELDACLSFADFIEVRTLKYGSFNISAVLAKYKNLKSLVSDDAHFAKDVGVLTNTFIGSRSYKDTYSMLEDMRERSKPRYALYLFGKKQVYKFLASRKLLVWFVTRLPKSNRAMLKKLIGLK